VFFFSLPVISFVFSFRSDLLVSALSSILQTSSSLSYASHVCLRLSNSFSTSFVSFEISRVDSASHSSKADGRSQLNLVPNVLRSLVLVDFEHITGLLRCDDASGPVGLSSIIPKFLKSQFLRLCGRESIFFHL
jgi:hypothetical protein